MTAPISPEVHTRNPWQRGNHHGRQNYRSLSSSFYPLQFCSSDNRKHKESSLPGTGFSLVAKTSKTGRSLATAPRAHSPPWSAGAGRGALRSLHPATELSFSMSCQPGTENPVFHAGRAHNATLPTIFQLIWKCWHYFTFAGNTSAGFIDSPWTPANSHCPWKGQTCFL